MPNTPENNCPEYCTVTVLQCRWCLQGVVVQQDEPFESAQKRIAHWKNCDQIKNTYFPAYVIDADAFGDLPDCRHGRVISVAPVDVEERLQDFENIRLSGRTDHNIKSIILFDNGMVMVFDQNGKQMSHYQGRKDNVWDMLTVIAPPDAEWRKENWWSGKDRKGGGT